MTDPVFSFTIRFTAAQARTAATDLPTSGTLELARDLARDLDAPITLRDAAGWSRFNVDVTGDYQAFAAPVDDASITEDDLDLDRMFPTPTLPAARRSRDARVAHTTNRRGW